MPDGICLEPTLVGREPEPIMTCPWFDDGCCGLYDNGLFPPSVDVYPCLYVDEKKIPID